MPPTTSNLGGYTLYTVFEKAFLTAARRTQPPTASSGELQRRRGQVRAANFRTRPSRRAALPQSPAPVPVTPLQNDASTRGLTPTSPALSSTTRPSIASSSGSLPASTSLPQTTKVTSTSATTTLISSASSDSSPVASSWTLYEVTPSPSDGAGAKPTPTISAQINHDDHLATGIAVALGLLSALSFVLIVIVALFLWRRRRERRLDTAIADTRYEIQAPDPRYQFMDSSILTHPYSSGAIRGRGGHSSANNRWSLPSARFASDSMTSVIPTFRQHGTRVTQQQQEQPALRSPDSLWDILTILPPAPSTPVYRYPSVYHGSRQAAIQPLTPPPSDPHDRSTWAGSAATPKRKERRKKKANSVLFPTLSLVRRTRELERTRSLSPPRTPVELVLPDGTVMPMPTPLHTGTSRRSPRQARESRPGTDDSNQTSTSGSGPRAAVGRPSTTSTFGQLRRSLEKRFSRRSGDSLEEPNGGKRSPLASTASGFRSNFADAGHESGSSAQQVEGDDGGTGGLHAKDDRERTPSSTGTLGSHVQLGLAH